MTFHRKPFHSNEILTPIIILFLLQRLTGGVLLLRNKFLIILYRGKDFVPSEVAKVVAERETELTQCQLLEEAARLKASESFSITHEQLISSDVMGTLSEFHIMHSEIGSLKKGKTDVDVELEAERERLEKELKDQQRKLFNVRFCVSYYIVF